MRFFPDRPPWPDGVEQYVREQTESLGGEKNVWYAWRVLTTTGWTAINAGDWVVWLPAVTVVSNEKFVQEYNRV